MSELKTEPAGPGVLERARIHALLSFHELWLRYFAIGGDLPPSEVRSSLTGPSNPDTAQYNLLVDALNERFTELGRDRPVLYATA